MLVPHSRHALITMDLTPYRGSSEFTHQGTVDWVALARAPVTVSFDILARCSKAGVDASTVHAGQVIGSFFIIPQKAQQEVIDHLRRLSSVALYGNVAWLGFGLRHVLYDLLAKDGGISFLALCGCLTQSYSRFFGAQVLRALCQLKNMPSELVPGILQWQSLLKSCEKIFSSSRFAKLLDEGFTPILASRTDRGMDECEATHPERLAEVITLLAQVSSKHLENLSIIGGVDCAWIAATAIFLFDLTVDIQTSDGEYLYRSDFGYRTWSGEAQVIFLKDAEERTSLKVARKCYILPNGRSLLRERSEEGDFKFQARSPWSSIIRDSFGTTAQDLLQGCLSGNFAMFLKYLASQSETYQDDYLPISEGWLYGYGWPRMRYCAGSPVGNDLLEFAIKRLPELQSCLETVMFQNFSISKDQAESHIRTMQEACTCQHCTGRRTTSRRYCVLEVAIAIPSYIRMLSATNVQDVLPVPDCLRAFSGHQCRLGREKSQRGLLSNPVAWAHSLFPFKGLILVKTRTCPWL